MKPKRKILNTTKGRVVEWWGLNWQLNTSELTATESLFANYDIYESQGISVSRAELFWWLVDYYWGDHANKKFIRHPWADRMTELACEYDWLAISGSTYSGKSAWGAVWGLVNWMVYPEKTKILITSTTMKEAKKRVWGYLREFYYGAVDRETGEKGCLPGKYLHSFGQIRANMSASDDTASDMSGMELIACGQSKEAQNVGRLIGIHPEHRTIVVGDELPELTPALLEASSGNLAMNPRFQFIGLGNHISWLDPFGVLATPKNGIKSVSVEDEGWETERGYCLHLDGLKSPNFDQEKDIWPIYGRKQKRQHEKEKPNSIQFWRMCRSFPPTDSEAGQIYSEIEIITNGGVSKPHWRGSVVKLAFLDPAFTSGGDRCQGIIGYLGMTVDNRKVLAVSFTKKFDEDVTNKDVPINFQLARQYIGWCKENGVDPENAGIDSTGGGIPFADIVVNEWSPRVLRVSFGGNPSSLPISETDEKLGTDAYMRRVDELWYQGIHYIRGSQIMGLSTEIIREMCSRRYTTRKRGDNEKVEVESKGEMKTRIGKSPDCFVAGTLILTPSGHVPIETLKMGDWVETPLGKSRVLVVHKTKSDSITTVDFSSGDSLSGKGKHGVFTWRDGKCRLDSLCLTMEMEHEQSLWKWRLRSLFFMPVKNFASKQAECTTNPTTKLRMKDFYTAEFGLKRMATFLKGFVYTISTEIGEIIGLKTFNSYLHRSIQDCICFREWLIQNFVEIMPFTLKKPLKLQGNGTEPNLAWSGTGKMQSDVLHSKRKHQGRARFAETFSNPFGNQPQCVPVNAGTSFTTRRSAVKKLASFAVKLGKHLVNPKRSVVPVRVQTVSTTETETYNLTLEEHNVYYANGILVFNCADAFFGLLEVARQRHGFFPVAFGEGIKQEMAEVKKEQEAEVRDCNSYDCLVFDYTEPEVF